MATTTIPREQVEAAADEQLAVWPYRWTRERYDLMVERGILGPGDHVQLIEGEILEMAPQKPPHMVAVGLVDDTLREVFGARYHTRTQGPVALGDHSEPEPDVAVVAGSR